MRARSARVAVLLRHPDERAHGARRDVRRRGRRRVAPGTSACQHRRAPRLAGAARRRARRRPRRRAGRAPVGTRPPSRLPHAGDEPHHHEAPDRHGRDRRALPGARHAGADAGPTALPTARRTRASTPPWGGSTPPGGRTRPSTAAGRPICGSRATSSSATTGCSSWSGTRPAPAGRGRRPSRNAERPARGGCGPRRSSEPSGYATLWASTSISRSTFLLTRNPPVSTAMFQLMPQLAHGRSWSGRSPPAWASHRPCPGPAPRNSPISVTGFVTPLIVQVPVQLEPSSRRCGGRPCW